MSTNKKEFRTIISFPPTLLFREDLIELEKIISDSGNHPSDKNEVVLGHDEQQIRAESMENLLNQKDLPLATDQLSISRRGWVVTNNGDDDINRTIDITMYHNFIHCQIFSLDQDWYFGKLEQLKTFFRKKKPWYAFLHKINPIYPTLTILVLFYSVYLVIIQSYLAAVLPTIVFFLFIFISIQTSREKLFPYVRVVTRYKQKCSIGLNEISTTIMLIASIATIAQFVLNTLNI